MTRAALTLAALLSAGTALAQPAGERALIEQGRALRRAGRNVEALEAFRAAYAQRPTPEAAGQIGFAEHALGRWEPAWRHLREALAEPRDPWVVAQREALDFSLRAVEAHLGSLRVESAAPGATVEIAGRVVATLPMREPLRVAGGTVVIETRAPGHRPDRREVAVGEGETVRVVVNLAPDEAPVRAETPAPQVIVRTVVVPGEPSPTPAPTPEPARPGGTIRALAWVATGSAVLFAGGGAAAMFLRDDAAARWNDDARCLVGGRTREQSCGDDRAMVGTMDSLMIAGFVGGGVLAVSAIVAFAAAPHARTESRVSVGIGPRGLSLGARF